MNDFTYDIPQFARRSKDFTPAKLQGCHAIVATAVITGAAVLAPASPQYKSWTITALDADTTVSVNHGFTVNGVATAPDFAIVQQLVSYATAAIPVWGITVTATQFVLVKTANTASGGAVPGTTVIAKVYLWSPHSEAS